MSTEVTGNRLKRSEAVRVLTNAFRRMTELRVQTGNVRVTVIYNNASGRYKTGLLGMFGEQVSMIITALMSDGVLTRQPTSVSLMTGVKSTHPHFLVSLSTDHTKLGE